MINLTKDSITRLNKEFGGNSNPPTFYLEVIKPRVCFCNMLPAMGPTGGSHSIFSYCNRTHLLAHEYNLLPVKLLIGTSQFILKMLQFLNLKKNM